MSSMAEMVENNVMDVLSGRTDNRNPHEAVADFARQVLQPDMALVVVFVAPGHDLDKMGLLFKASFPDCPVIGCTTSGEITPDGYSENSVTGFSLSGKNTKAKPYAIESVKNLQPETIQSIKDDARKKISNFHKNHKNSNEFALFFVDGMSGAEERSVALLYQALQNIPLIGGSAGDNLRFKETFVLVDGEFKTDAAVATLICTTLPFETFKTQHFIPTETKLVITSADPSTRTVYEINGLPAAEEYARLIGVSQQGLLPAVFSRFPLMLRIGGEYYVRSLQKKNDDGSLTFYCAIDNGLVLTIGKGVDLVENLNQALMDVSSRVKDPQLLITCECILRRVEVLQDGLTDRVDDILKKYNAIGFHSYGEQFNAVHVNQTFSGVMIGRKQ